MGPYAQDGLPDAWQKHHFGPGNPEGVPDGDPDEDGQSNRLEYLAGSDPTDPASRLKVWCEGRTKEDQPLRISFTPCLEDRDYSLWGTADLIRLPFGLVDSNPTDSQEGVRWITLPPSADRASFYRLQIALPAERP